MRVRVIPTVLLTLVLLQGGNAAATEIDPLLWQEFATYSDFIGVVECTVAGGIVAEYRVVETIKGDEKPGASLLIRTAVNYWEPQYPLVLVGDRLLVAGRRDNVMRMANGILEDTVPLWWRRARADYALPLFQGAWETASNQPLHDLGSKRTTLDAFKTDVADFLALHAEERDLALLRALAGKYLGERVANPSAVTKKTLEDVNWAKNLRDALDVLLSAWRNAPDDAHSGYYLILLKAGPLTREILKAEPPSTFRSDYDLQRLLQRWAYDEKLPPEAQPAPPVPPDSRVLEEWSANLGQNLQSRQHEMAFRGMTIHDPATTASWLAGWVNVGASPADTDRGYFLGSEFGQRCEKDCAVHLTALTGARDPYVRAAAAIYLALEDEAAGVPALREAMRLSGDPGAWAGLALARRGDRDGLMRAIEVLGENTELPSIAVVLRRNLKKRVAELLSNTAAAIGKPTPLRPDDSDALSKAREFLAANLDARPIDPWLADLRAQKID